MVLKNLFSRKSKMPLHVGLNLASLRSKVNDAEDKKGLLQGYLSMIETVHKLTIKKEIPIVTLLLSRISKKPFDDQMVKSLVSFFNNLAVSKFIAENQVKISVLGKWYDLPEPLVESIKLMLSETKEYDKHFLNFCLQYDGQDEIIDGLKILLTKITHERVEAFVDYNAIKENLASSYFLPPEMLFVPDDRRRTDGLLLWDNKNARLFLSEKPFEKDGEEEFVHALAQFSRK